MLRKKLLDGCLVVLCNLRRQSRRLNVELLFTQLAEESSTLLLRQVKRSRRHGWVLQRKIVNNFSGFSIKNLTDDSLNKIGSSTNFAGARMWVVQSADVLRYCLQDWCVSGERHGLRCNAITCRSCQFVDELLGSLMVN